jgi:CheY-like chemotaxis protein
MANGGRLRHCREVQWRGQLSERNSMAPAHSDDVQHNVASQTAEPTIARPRLELTRVLVAGGERQRQAYVDAFLPKGYCVLFAATAADAISLADELLPAVILLDVRLATGATGLALTRRFRSNPRLASVPIVALCGPDDDVAEASNAGCDFVVARRTPHHLEPMVTALIAPVGATTAARTPNAYIDLTVEHEDDHFPAPPQSSDVQQIIALFREMPGLCLSPEQVRRLAGLPHVRCASALAVLQSRHLLCRREDGRYVAIR